MTLCTHALVSAGFLIILPMAAANAGPIANAGDAVADAATNGYSKIALAEHSRKEWEVWASKDGLSYELKIDAQTGAVLQTIPLDSDD